MSGLFAQEDFSLQLFSVWRDLLAEKKLPAMDRWLKNRNKMYRSATRGNPKGVKASATLPTSLTLSAALISGVRFMQLASCLEHAYTHQLSHIDWLDWDSRWEYADVKKIPLAHFWYWIELRTSSMSDEAPPSHPKKMRDQVARAAFFSQWSVQMNTSDNMPAFLLWNGLRPQWLPLLIERAALSHWSEADICSFIRMQTQTPPLWLRAQGGKTAQDIYARLQHQGVSVAMDEGGHVYARGGKGITSTQAYQDGFVEIQDLASQMIAGAVAAQPGQKVWDACAGAGGKTLAVASSMNNKGVIVATDLHGYKLDELKRRSKRAGFYNVRTFEWTGTAPLRLPKEVAQQQGFDWVLVDAPCTSAGTWRRNPDARWRFDEADTAELIALQRQLLTHVIPAVRQGGYLVYATCSWQASENEQQIEWFVQNHPQFTLHSQSLLGAPALDADTMFVAVLKLS